MEPNWLAWAKRLQAIAQNGLTFATDPFDVERYEEVLAVAADIRRALVAMGEHPAGRKVLGRVGGSAEYKSPIHPAQRRLSSATRMGPPARQRSATSLSGPAQAM